MRYELDDKGYVCKVFFGCFSGTCTLYEGETPTGYTTLEEWATNANVRAYKIVEGNLAYDSERATELQTLWELQGKKILWQGAMYMKDTQVAELSELVSEQATGIVLVWSSYRDGVADNSNWTYCFIPKQHVQYANGSGIDMHMSGTAFGGMCCKYVYVSDDKIAGHASNDDTGTANGITYTNNLFVLRYVLGV